MVSPPQASQPRSTSGCHAAATPLLDAIFGNGAATSALASCTVVPTAGISSRRTSIRASEASHSVAISESGSFDEDPTPRASEFGSRVTFPVVPAQGGSSLTQRGRPQHLSIVVPPRNVNVHSLRPAVGVEPHAPSETESSASVRSTSSPTSPVARVSSPAFPTTQSDSGTSSSCVPPSTPPNARISTMLPGITSPSYHESGLPAGFSPRQRKRAMSRSQTPPPLPRPPPSGPLPAVPSSVPPVPPLPPLLSKMNMSPNSVISSPPRSTMAGALTNPATALPPSPPGGLRLPSRLSWVNTVRAVLPSPPASPTKALRSLTGKTSLPISPSKAEINRPNELKRPTSIGVIEAADNVQVRRTKSILLLGARSKSTASLGTKRVQIHADVNVDACTVRKPRRKSSAATLGHPTSCSDFGPMIISSSELLVPRERRHSAPVLSSFDSSAPSADWTLSLPFCIDTPGNKIVPSPLLTPQSNSEQKLEELQGDDWTLCMPLKVRVGTPTVESAEGPDSECTLAKAEAVEAQHNVQLPTPSASPTWPTPTSVARPLDPEFEESVPPSPVERPASPASLGPHVGGLDLDGGRGKRASGWHVYGWFDEVSFPEDDDRDLVASTTIAVSDSKQVKNHVSVFRKAHDLNAGRHPSQDSMSTVSTSATFYSACSS
ncbi:hypothetical protein V8E55_001215 [Tylopilus felleus]